MHNTKEKKKDIKEDFSFSIIHEKYFMYLINDYRSAFKPDINNTYKKDYSNEKPKNLTFSHFLKSFYDCKIMQRRTDLLF